MNFSAFPLTLYIINARRARECLSKGRLRVHSPRCGVPPLSHPLATRAADDKVLVGLEGIVLR